MSRKIFIITGEPSGDLHGSNLVKELLKQSPTLEIQCWGGDRMAAAGATVTKHIDELSFMGFVEVVANLPTILSNFTLCKKQIAGFQPDLVVLIDFPGFNLRMAKHIHRMGIPVAYYIAPQVWAWKASRVKQIKAYVDHVYVILPFEQPFLAKHGIHAEFVGHPLLDELQPKSGEAAFTGHPNLSLGDKPVIALLPGSRKQEIQMLLKPIAKLIEKFPSYQFVVSKVAWQPMGLYASLPKGAVIMEGNTHALLKASEAAIVTSGTATLETALIGTPQVVVYKAHPITIMIARTLVKVKFISLVNLIMDKECVKELIQDEVNLTSLTAELKKILKGGDKRASVLSDYAVLKEKLGHKGTSAIVANRLLKIIG